ncbi:hypothetical protein [Nocardioides luteus]|uniref:hypothetical protein n=1 Tax=Nocardioides luteus TaxID=1844 RepID=UPI0018CBEB81|nr:hypothetical protein [Nocardioides luteus]MBG6099514.1 hypothetical protein [Nocardioides luteus]
MSAMIEAGRRCVGVRRFHHKFAGDEPSATGPIEFRWSDGTYTTVDVGSDWVLTIEPQPWTDPFGDVSDAERRRLAEEVGLWEVDSSPDQLASAVGRVLTDVALTRNEVGELVGICLSPDGLRIDACVDGGELDVVLTG